MFTHWDSAFQFSEEAGQTEIIHKGGWLRRVLLMMFKIMKRFDRIKKENLLPVSGGHGSKVIDKRGGETRRIFVLRIMMLGRVLEADVTSIRKNLYN